jgi:hypothetical protein
MDLDQITKRLEDHEARLRKLEIKPEKAKAAAKPVKSGGLAALEALKVEGFFAQKQPVSEILKKLAEKGVTYKRAESLTYPLLEATRREILKRKQGEKGWEYYV